ncbi:MAG: NAD-dependent epimerase/dehydratase family protein [Euryarchaeota archaeon]|nr:NAD-dependent epimerase/dehydratase family protein [Euryarchaeota archaeon]
MTLALVTGATGLLGSHLAESLVSDGFQVRCLVRKTSQTDHLKGLGVELATGDITDPKSLAGAARGAQVVFHCAAQLGYWSTPEDFRRVNVEGTRHLLRAAHRAEVDRLVHTSTAAIYGTEHPPGRLVRESDPSNPGDGYSTTKLQAEKEVWKAHKRGLRSAIIRPGLIYGPRDTMFFPLFARLVRLGVMPLVEGGQARYQPAYVTDIAQALRLAARSKGAPGRAFNAVGPETGTFKEFTDTLAGVLHAPKPWIRVPMGPLLVASRVAEIAHGTLKLSGQNPFSPYTIRMVGTDQLYDTTRARKMLGYKPKVGVREGLEKTAKWFEGKG